MGGFSVIEIGNLCMDLMKEKTERLMSQVNGS
jgi:hypothetical protein